MSNIKIFDYFNYALIFIFLLFTLQLYSQDNQNTPEYILNMKEIAEKGNSDVQYNLGLIYSNGEDVEKDLKEAIAGGMSLLSAPPIKTLVKVQSRRYENENFIPIAVQQDRRSFLSFLPHSL